MLGAGRIRYCVPGTCAGGYATRLTDVARRVQWNCPTCSRMRWRMQFAWPASMTESEAKRLVARARN